MSPADEQSPAGPLNPPEDRDGVDRTPADPIDSIARAIRAVPGVFDLHAGVLGEVATYLPGRRVNGIRLRSPGADIHLVLEWGAVIATTTDLVRNAVRGVVEGPIDVTVEDVAPPGETAPAPTEESVSS